MTVRLSGWIAAVVLLASVTAHTAGQVDPDQEAKPAGERPSEVIVLSALLAVELTPSDLAGRVALKNKREYQNAVYPLLEKHRWKAVAI